MTGLWVVITPKFSIKKKKKITNTIEKTPTIIMSFNFDISK